MPLSQQAIQSSLKARIDKLNKSADPNDPEASINNFCKEMTEWALEMFDNADVTCTIPAGAVSTGASPSVVPLPAPLPISGSIS